MAASISARLKRIAVLGWGNPSRGDDGLGPALVHQLERAESMHSAWPSLHLVVMHQLQPEHVLELENCDAAIFVDAATGLEGPYVFRSITPAADIRANTHAFTPAELLLTYNRALDTAPPRSFSLELAGSKFGLDVPLSEQAKESVALAVGFLEWAFDHPAAEEWLARADSGKRRGS
jgi:hydrogenase maturation protease